jgi:hypothetical protein
MKCETHVLGSQARDPALVNEHWRLNEYLVEWSLVLFHGKGRLQKHFHRLFNKELIKTICIAENNG